MTQLPTNDFISTLLPTDDFISTPLPTDDFISTPLPTDDFISTCLSEYSHGMPWLLHHSQRAAARGGDAKCPQCRVEMWKHEVLNREKLYLLSKYSRRTIQI
jgi:hypothetical protein